VSTVTLQPGAGRRPPAGVASDVASPAAFCRSTAAVPAISRRILHFCRYCSAVSFAAAAHPALRNSFLDNGIAVRYHNVINKQHMFVTNNEDGMQMTAKARLQRMFSPEGKCFDVAIDHGFFNEYSFLASIEDMKQAVETVVRANPDCIQLSVGQARHLQEIPGKHKPGLVLRTDAANIYGSKLPRYLFSEIIDDAIEHAVRLDAVAVCVNLLLLPEQPELHYQCVKNVMKLKSDCERYGMVLMVEPLVMLPNETKGGYMVDGDIGKIMPLVRQAVELGADVIKADPCDNVEEYHRVIEVASGIPVLVRGGGRASDEEIVTRTVKLMQQGAAGIVYGRNVIQHPNPERMTRALMGIVHKGDDAATALAVLNGDDAAAAAAAPAGGTPAASALLNGDGGARG